MFQGHGRSNDFRELRNRLFLVATDLDTCESVEFGAPGLDRVPISKAVQASSALPGLYPPVRIGGRYYVDGALRKTLHASVALREGADLVLCVNPLIPFDASLAARRGQPVRENLVEGGLPVVLSQTFRSLIYSRMQVGMSTYENQYTDAHVVLFQPERDDAEMFFTNVFSYANRHRVFQHAYQGTLDDLAARKQELEPVLNRYGISIRTPAGGRPVPAPSTGTAAALEQLGETLDRLEQWMNAGRALEASK
jgi:NTE family protein